MSSYKLTPMQKAQMFRLSVEYVACIRNQDIRKLREVLRETREAMATMKENGSWFQQLYKVFYGDTSLSRLPEDNFLLEAQKAYDDPGLEFCRVCGRSATEEVQSNGQCEACNVALEGYGE